MLLFLLSKRKPRSAILPLFTAHRCCSATSIQNPDPEPFNTPNFSIVDYLVASFGFSSEKAVKVSKSIAHIKSPQSPDAVHSFLQHYGLTDAAIKAFITLRPSILCASVDKTIAPNLRALSEMGLSTSALTTILLSDPATIQLHSSVSRIKFWKDFLGGDEAALVRAFKNNRGLVTHDISTSIQPKISILQRHGLSNHDIGRIVVGIPRFITGSFTTIEDTLKRTKELGFQPESGMFLQGFQAMICNNRDLFEKKRELLIGLGWSQAEFPSAVRKAPRWLTLSQDKLKVKMDYLLQEARCNASYIAARPLLLALSLEKRLRPRQHVLCQLKSAGDYWSAMSLTDNKFVERYILSNEKIIPGLHEAYLTACGIQSTNSCKDVEVRYSVLDANGERCKC